MQRLVELKDFDSFILEKKENNVNRDSLIEKAVSKLKKEFGATAKDFIASTKQSGIDEIQDLVARTLKPYLYQTDSNDLQYDYDSLLYGLVSWILFETKLKLDETKQNH